MFSWFYIFNDILLYNQTLIYHYKHLRIVFELLRKHQLVIKASKCNFCSEQVKYLDHIISKQGVAIDPHKVQVIVGWPLLKNLKQLRGLLRLTRYGAICKPLTWLLKKDPIAWNDKVTRAFNQLKELMTNAPMLALLDLNKLFMVETDASLLGVRAVLMQEGHPIAFISKFLRPKQQTMFVYKRKMMDIMHAVTKWKHYL